MPAPTRRWSCPWASSARCSAGFEATHRQRYGFVVPGKALIVEAVSVELVGETEKLAETRSARRGAAADSAPKAQVRFFSARRLA